jgi:transposase
MSTLNTPVQDCYVALELSRTKWLVGALLPGRAKVITTLVPGGNAAKLIEVLRRLATQACRTTDGAVSLKVCYEAGYDGFWLARHLISRGIETHVLDPASFLVSRRGGIVTLARKLAIALWRFVETGLVPEGARLSP